MEPVYVDIHIHTSDDADNLNTNYDVKSLYQALLKKSKGKPVLISLSDHNTINKNAYMKLKQFFPNIIVGAEIHIQYDDAAPPYHAHILFNVEVNDSEIDKLNLIFNHLYKRKMVTSQAKIPFLHKIVQCFENYDFLLLPHGGQSHSTFDGSIPSGAVFDTTMERSVYYNQFDGFTARSPERMEKTIEYFKKLGIVEFINLITCSDNYKPFDYPRPKATDSSEFVPTWMLADPSFEGLRISLSEKSRLVVSNDPPDYWQQCLEAVVLRNEKIDIDIKLLPGLNVVIGSSSTGKTLLVDSIHKKIINEFYDSAYNEYGVSEIQVGNKSNQVPHYIHQTYISSLFSKKNSIGDMVILRNLFPSQIDLENRIQLTRNQIKQSVESFFNAVSSIKELEEIICQIPVPTSLLHHPSIRLNVISTFLPSLEDHKRCIFPQADYDKYSTDFIELESRLKKNPFAKDLSREFRAIKNELEIVFEISKKEEKTYDVFRQAKTELDNRNKQLDEETRSKLLDFDRLIDKVKEYRQQIDKFYSVFMELTTAFQGDKKVERTVGEYTLSVEYKMFIDDQIFLDSVNSLFNSSEKKQDLTNIQPEDFFLERMRNNLHSKKNYPEIATLVTEKLNEHIIKKYQIVTKDNETFDHMSPGTQSSIILDLILGHREDSAPIIIDQPEDNLSKEYMTTKMIASILTAKKHKQIIFVTHTASIPMLGDAQNIILCRNIDNKLVIRSGPLEGEIDGKKVVDYVAKLTDGGKASVKKRFKKYNMKTFRGEE